MSNRSEYVKAWRKRTKQRIIDAFGGGCACCNYKICQEALDLHHLNPNEKEFSFGAIRASPRNWAGLVVELRKCILVCSNCHREIHAGIRTVPLEPKRFDEKFTEYKKLLEQEPLTPCKVCGGPKPKFQKTCSYECANKIKGTIKWEEWDVLDLKDKQKMSWEKISELVGCSATGVRKRYTKLTKLI
jgi:hypothetical protein